MHVLGRNLSGSIILWRTHLKQNNAMAEQYIAPYEINQIPSTVPVDICGLSAR